MATAKKVKQPSRAGIKAAFREARKYLRRPYVTGVTVGEPIRAGKLHERSVAICIHVEEKRARRHLPAEQIFPRQILGVPVDVVERIHRPHDMPDSEVLLRQIIPSRPLQPGVAISTQDGNFGTLGMIVFDRVDGAPCVLSAAHVFRAGTSSTVVQPGANAHGGPIGRVVRWLLDSDGDAAIARLDEELGANAEPLGLGITPRRLRRVSLNQRLRKSSARTGITEGVVTSVGEISVLYGDGSTVTMHGFEIRPVDPTNLDEISDEGDSGAIWQETETGDAMGLTVGGDRFGAADPNEFVLACHLDLVFNRLQVTLDPDDHLPL